MNRYNHPLNNPHTFCFVLSNNRTYDEAYTLPVSTPDTPTDTDDLARRLTDSVIAKCSELGWNCHDLSIVILPHSPQPSDMTTETLYNLYSRVRRTIDSL